MNQPPKELPQALPSKEQPRQPTHQEIREARRTHADLLLAQATGYAGAFLSHMLPMGRVMRVRQAAAPEVVVARVREFFSARPRPWRTHQNRRRNRRTKAFLNWMSAKIDKELQKNG